MGAAAVATLVPLAAATPAEAQTAGGGTSVTNLVLWSENLNQAVWSKANVTVGQSPVLSPRNDSAAWRVTATAAGSNDVLQQGMPNLVSGASYTFSIYVRYVNQPWIMVTSWSQNPAQAFFNIQTGTAGSRLGNCTGSSIKAAGGGWYRLSLTLTAGRNSAWPGIYPAGGDNYVNARLGDAYDIAFPQFETGSSASSYVGPTAGSPLTSQPVNGYVNTGDFAVSLGYGNNAPRLLIPANGPVTLDGAPGAGDNALSIPTTSWFWSNNGGYVTPDVFGLAGDGIKDDTLAFRKMLQSGRNVVLKQGATYLVSGSLQYGVSGQQIYLNGATVKRAAQVFSQTTADLTGGSTNVITVASTTGFAVGQTVSLRPPAGLGRAYVVNPGSGYSTTPTATITGGGGTGATASVGIDSASGRVTALAITSPGSGYTSQPSVILSGGGGSGATAQVSLQTAAADGCPTPGVITGVSGNQVIVSGASWSGAYPAGSVLFTCGFTFFASGTSGNGLHGPGIVDGNRGAATGAAPNAPYASWTTTAEVFVTAAASARHVVEGVNFRNLPGEGIVLVGSYNEVRNNVIENAGGNGIHLSLSDPATGYGPGHILITGNRVVNTNLDVTVGHENGCIAWSDDIGHSEVVNNYLDTTPLWGFGGIDGLGNNDITLSNNVVVNCGAGALLVNASSQVTVNRIAFTGNRVTNCGLGRGTYAVDIFQYYQPSPPVPIQSVVVADNIFELSASGAGGVRVYGAQGVSISGNLLVSTTAPNGGQVGVDVFGSQQVAVTGNAIRGFTTAVRLSPGPGPSNNPCRSVSIVGNVLAGASRYGVLGTPGGVLGASLTVSSNTVEGDVTVGTNWTGISAHENTTVSANSIFVDSAAGSTGIALTGSNNLVQGNLIRSGAPSVPAVGLSVDGASTGNTVVSNAITANAALAINVNGASVNDASVGMGNYKVAG